MAATHLQPSSSRLYRSVMVPSGEVVRLVVVLFVLAGTPVAALHAATYPVGPGKAYASLCDVPWDHLKPGDVVKIYARAKPYKEKILLRRSGSPGRPLVIQGIPQQGRFPVIDGEDAVQCQEERQPHRGRWLIKVGDDVPADHVHLENLHIRNASNVFSFRFKDAKKRYQDNAAGILVVKGHHVLIDGCVIHGCGNGVQTAYAPDVSHLTIRRCWIYDNGNRLDPSAGQQHNVYLCGIHTTVEFSMFDPNYGSGNNIKDRGSGTVVRYNWIRGGASRQLDFVDFKAYRGADAFVYGNVIIQSPRPENRTMIHWGGDGDYSRSGRLDFFNNTVVAKVPGAHFFDVDRVDCGVKIVNNLFLGQGVLWHGQGTIEGNHNWFSMKIKLPLFWRSLHLGVQGVDPLLCGIAGIPYFPCPTSPLVDSGSVSTPKPVQFMPSPHFRILRRPRDQHMDVGAFEFPRRGVHR